MISFDHHCYIIEGEKESILTELFDLLKTNFDIDRAGNPNIFIEDSETFSIDQGRALKEMQSQKAMGGGKKIFIVTTNSITHDAQNSLLKVFEEPTPETFFFFVMNSSQSLLPTLLSRARLVIHSSSKNSTYVEDAKKFLKAKPVERLELVKPFIEAKKRGDVRMFVIALIAEVRHSKDEANEKARKLETLMEALSYSGDQASSIKLILEHLSLVL